MGKGGIKRLDLDAKGKTPKFTEMTGRRCLHDCMHTTWPDVCAFKLLPL